MQNRKTSTYDTASRVVLIGALLIIGAMSTGCSNMTVVKLASMCYEHDSRPAVSFTDDNGKVDCHS